MNKLNSGQRKLVYILCALVLLIPIYLLGEPSGAKADSSGGMLAQLRHEHDLGESDLGEIDPTSVTMNLMLLGLRGIAVNMLRMDLDHYKDHKEWARMRATTEAVITLQPHYIEVWDFLSWNLAYNVSAEWDAVPDRFYWVKEGGKFAQRGSRRNVASPELYWYTGRIWGQKVGRSDEWKLFRGYFLNDPDDDRFGDAADEEINPDQTDNYLVARDWYARGNTAEQRRVQHIMMRAIFRSYPDRSLLDYADALQREGKFDEFTVQRWEVALNGWINDYGQDRFRTSSCEVFLEANEDAVKDLATAQDVPVEEVERSLVFVQNVVNYRYWRTRARAEAEQETGKAHRKIYAGEQSYLAGDLDKARDELLEGMNLFADLLQRYPEFEDEDLSIEEGMWAVLLWQRILQLTGEPIPDNFRLKPLWDKHQGRMSELEIRFNRLGME